MEKKIDLNQSIFALSKAYPEVVDIMFDLGFAEIKKPAMLASVGKVMNIKRGSKMKNIPMDKIIRAFVEKGFTVVDGENELKKPSTVEKERLSGNGNTEEEKEGRPEKLRKLLDRLSLGEDIEKVREDFVRDFQDVDPAEIMKAEQGLMESGMPLSKVQKLCDVHSALFHGESEEEKIENAEKAVQASLKKGKNYINESKEANQLVQEIGHPLYTFTMENQALEAYLQKTKGRWEEVVGLKEEQKKALIEELSSELDELRNFSIHYAKKGDLLYPLLKIKYDISGPSQVMWTVDDEIRDTLGELKREIGNLSFVNQEFVEKYKAVRQRMEEMIYKEENILFPMCALQFQKEEWVQIYFDSKDYAPCFLVENHLWDEAEGKKKIDSLSNQEGSGEIVMPGGHLKKDELIALLNTIPVEITFVDKDNINRFFNEGPKVFKRPQMAIDREVFSCHPPKIEPMVRSIISDFREGKQDKLPIWMEKGGKPFLVTYMAVRDEENHYVGTLEAVQDMEEIKEHFKEYFKKHPEEL